MITKILLALGGILAAILTAFRFMQNSKEIIAENNKVKDSLKEDDKKIQENNTALAVEEQKREDLKQEKTDNTNVVDFFNNRK